MGAQLDLGQVHPEAVLATRAEVDMAAVVGKARVAWLAAFRMAIPTSLAYWGAAEVQRTPYRAALEAERSI